MAEPQDGILHVRCGSDIRHPLRQAGLGGRYLEFSDPYCQGPLRVLPDEAFLAERAAFVSAAYGGSRADARARLARQYASFDAIGPGDRVVLWFEHDSYDQLILARCLDRLATLGRAAAVDLICVDSAPGVRRFIGLGQLSPAQLRRLWDTHRRPVTGADLDLGRAAWAAIRAPDPRRLADLAAAGTPAVPPMARALSRHLAELPDPAGGLGLTQRLVLEIVGDAGTASGGDIFRRLLREREPLPFLGDLMLWHVLDDLCDSATPVLRVDPATAAAPWPERRLSLTAAGRDCLDGGVDFLTLYRGERWVGGIRVAGSATPPRWDAGRGSLAVSA